MPWDIFVYKGLSKEWAKDEFHFSHSLLNVQPNPAMSKYDFMKALAARVDLDGNGYAQIVRNGVGDPIGLVLITGDVSMYLRPDYTTYYEVKDSLTGRNYLLDGENMLHVKNFSYDGLVGVSTLTHAENITSLSKSADAQAKGYYVSGVNMNGIITVPNKIGADKARDLKASWADSVGYNSTTGRAGGVVVLEAGAEFKPIQVNPKDAQMLETRQFNVVDVCRFFGVHPSKAFDTNSDSYANIEAYQLGFITDTITPFKTRFEAEFNRKLFRPSQRDNTRVEMDIEYLMSADLTTKAGYYSQMFQLGVFSPNDICRKEKEPISEKGNDRYVQVNLAPLGQKPEPEQNKNTGI
jgi:HK97 family phage portal protein